jgi:hypothetical protein
MEYLTFILYTLIFISILTPVAIVIFEFFDIKFETYGNYLLWFIALAIFNAILPVKTKNIFGDITKPLEAGKEKLIEVANKSLDVIQRAAASVKAKQEAAAAAAATAAAATAAVPSTPKLR